MNENNKIKFQSYSGAEFKFLNIENQIFINKKINLKKFNIKKRSITQIQKQLYWNKKNLCKPFESVPINYKISKNYIMINMPFVYGYSGSDILIQTYPKEINKFVKELSNLIYFFKENKNANKFINKKILLKKIINIKKLNYSGFLKYLKLAEKYLEDVPNDLESTWCHGDLTLSNMIISDDFKKENNNKKIDHKIYLIDWLDNDFEIYYNDLAKLKQDLYHGWSSRNLLKSQKVSCSIFGKYIWSQIENKFINKDNYKIFRFFSILCILRIIPYAQNKNDLIWLKQTLDKEYQSQNKYFK